jgi:hypothetical protein
MHTRVGEKKKGGKGGRREGLDRGVGERRRLKCIHG